jgi:hypothetical protein
LASQDGDFLTRDIWRHFNDVKAHNEGSQFYYLQLCEEEPQPFLRDYALIIATPSAMNY